MIKKGEHSQTVIACVFCIQHAGIFKTFYSCSLFLITNENLRPLITIVIHKHFKEKEGE